MITRITIALALATACANAQPASQKMLDASVIVYGAVQKDGKPTPVSRGGGFLLDQTHVVTSLNACCGKTDKGEQATPIVVSGQDGAGAKVVWGSQEMDMAVLELEKPFNHQGVAIAPMQATQKDQPVYTVQFPNPSENSNTPSVTQGKLVGVVKMDKSDLQVYRSTAPMNQANSGGALFDACGNAMGVNIMFKEGSQYAFVIDPLVPGLQASGIQAAMAAKPCAAGGGGVTESKPAGGGGGGGKTAEKQTPAAPREWRMPQGNEWIPVVVLIGVASMAFRKNTRQQLVRAMTSRRQPVPEPAPYPYPAPVKKPSLRGIAGQYAGTSIALDAGPSTLGRDQHAANLVFPQESDSVSKRHCQVRWDAARQVFVLEDFGSTNGTFLGTGERLTPGQPRDLRPGDRFYIGDLRNQFEVGME